MLVSLVVRGWSWRFACCSGPCLTSAVIAFSNIQLRLSIIISFLPSAWMICVFPSMVVRVALMRRQLANFDHFPCTLTLLLFVGTILAKGREKISLGFEHANNSMWCHIVSINWGKPWASRGWGWLYSTSWWGQSCSWVCPQGSKT